MKSWYTISNLAPDTAEVRIYDDIGAYGVSAKQFCCDFNAIKAAKIDLRINSYGGECFDAAAICTAIREHSAEVTAHVDGVAASAASVIAAACDEVQISKSAFMMIHRAAMYVFGNTVELMKGGQMLSKLDDTIAQGYADRAAKAKVEKTQADFIAAMDAETWMNAQEAKDWGMVDLIKNDEDEDEQTDDDDADPSDATNHSKVVHLLLAKYRNVPADVQKALAKRHYVNQARVQRQQGNAMLKVINRDGKSFVMVDGREQEIEITSLPTSAKANIDAAVNAAREDAVKTEREYRTMFNTVAASAALSGESLVKFEKDFYGRSETDLKFLAQHAIGSRANPVGEGSGAKEPAPKEAAEEKDIRTYCIDRLTRERDTRMMFKVASNNPNDPGFKAGLERFIAVETKSRADWSRKGTNSVDEQDRHDDPVGRVLKNSSIIEQIK